MLAVVPFESYDPSVEPYFVDGLTEELIAEPRHIELEFPGSYVAPRRAIETDPNYRLAYSGLADTDFGWPSQALSRPAKPCLLPGLQPSTRLNSMTASRKDTFLPGKFFRSMTGTGQPPNGSTTAFTPAVESWFPDSVHLVVSWVEDTRKPPGLRIASVLGGTPRKLAEVGSFARVSPDESELRSYAVHGTTTKSG
jgi:hypothetical protein